MKLPEPLKQINFHPPKIFFSKEKNSYSYANFSSEKPDFSLQEKFFILTSIQPIFKKKKKKSYTCLKKILIPLRKRKIPNQKNLSEKTIFQTKTFLCLSKKLIYYTRTKKLNGSILVIF